MKGEETVTSVVEMVENSEKNGDSEDYARRNSGVSVAIVKGA